MSRFLPCVLALLLAGCGLPSGVSRETVESKGTELSDLSRSRIVAVTDEPYVGARAVPLAKNTEYSAGVFARQITLNRRGTLAELCAVVSKLTGLSIMVDSSASRATTSSGGTTEAQMDADLAERLGLPVPASAGETRNRPVGARTTHITYEGPVKGLLDQLGSRFGLAWDYSPNSGVVYSTTAIRTFTIWAAPGQVTYTNNITNQSKEQQTQTAGAGVSMQETSNQTAQTNTTNLTFDIWKDVEEGVKGLLSPNGTVVGNQAAGTITVKDTAASLRKIEKFIDEINERLSRQIALSIKVWSLELADSTDVGLNLGMFFENPDVRVFAGSVSPRWEGLGGELSAAVVDGRLRDSTALLKALRSVGRATQVTSGGGVVMSNQPVPVQAIRREAYLAGSSSTTTQYGEEKTLTPGEITTGFAMTVIPHIMEGRRVVLQYTINLSSLDDIVEFSSGDSSIQLPKVSSRSFSQRMTLKMGQTLVLAGFEQEIDGRNASAGLLGIGRAKSYKKSLMVITISTESGDV
jgi:type IVB pilus formation R64 PilN family outer membrane protein